MPEETTPEFVAKLNVEHFRAQLENGADLAQHPTLLWLLVEEENKLGLTHEQLNEIDRQITRIKQIVQQQVETVAMLKANGHSMERAERALSNMIDLLLAHQTHREKIEAALSRPNPGRPAAPSVLP